MNILAQHLCKYYEITLQDPLQCTPTHERLFNGTKGHPDLQDLDLTKQRQTNNFL